MPTPEELLRVKKNKPAPRLVLGNTAAQTISNQFLKTAQAGLNAKAKRDAKAAKAKLDFNETLLKNDLDTIRVQSEAELADTKGVETLEQATEIKDKFLRNAKARLDKVPEQYKRTPEMQTAMFKSAGKFDRFAIGNIHSESRKVADKAYKERTANEMNDMVDHAADVDYLATTGIAGVSSSIRRDLERTYGDNPNRILPSGETSGDLINAQVATGVSEAIRKSIAQQLNVNDPELAAETLRVLNDQIVPADRIEIMKMVDRHKKKSKDTQALAISDEAFRLSNGNEEMAFEIVRARSGDDAALYTKAIQIVSGKAAVQARQKKKNIEINETNAYKAMLEGDFNSPAYKALPQDEKDNIVKRFNDNGGRYAVVTDQEKKTQIDAEIEAMTDADFAKVNVREVYGPFLGNKDLGLVETRQQYIKKQIASEYSHGQKWNASVPANAISNFMSILGISKADSGNLSRDIQTMYSQLKEENPKLTITEQAKKLDAMIYDRITIEKDTSFFGGFFGEELETFQELPEEGLADRGRDSAKIKRIQSMRLKNGQRPYTESQINRFLSTPE